MIELPIPSINMLKISTIKEKDKADLQQMTNDGTEL